MLAKNCLLICRVLCRSWFSIMVPIWENQGFWPKGPCCKALYYFPTITCCCSCRNFSSRWLLASLAGCIHWGSYRSIFQRFTFLHWLLVTNETLVIILLTLCAGLTVASFCYLQFFPPPYDIDGIFFLISISILLIDLTIYTLMSKIYKWRC